MNSLETEYFSELSKDRTDSANTLEKPSMIGIRKSVVEKYSDQAHFIYELLQNADDAHAVNARFVLEHDRLIFAHDGTRHFSVSNPANEDEDSKHGRLGDINSITSIANSTKTEASIGKFGVGFKAVFQYTQTPRIYDPEFRFEIDRFIVPNLLPNDAPERRPEETLFEFPFNHPERDAGEAYGDISKKLKNLVFPLLFLSHLENIEFTFGGKSGNYRKTIEKTLTFGDTDAEKILLSRHDGDKSFRSRLWLFSRTYDGEHRYSVGYFLDDKGHLAPVKRPAFCFFTTKEATGLNFMIHAPFQLTDSREGIRAGVKHNERMIDLLAALSADALSYLKEIGIRESVRLIDDSIVKVIPVDPESFSDPDDKDRISFMPFYTAIKEKLEEDELLPAKGGYVSSENAYWAQYPVFTELFSNEQLGDIVGNSSAKWVFPSISRDKASTNRPLISYIDSLIKTNLTEEAIITGRSYNDIYVATFGQNRDLVPVKGITAEFIEKQPVTWLHQFYKWMSETSRRKEYSKSVPIFLDQDGDAAAAYDDNDELVLFLPVPGSDMSGYRVVNHKLLDNKETKKFLVDLGVKQPSLRDQIYNTILPQYEKDGEIDTDAHFRLFFDYFLKCPNEEVDDFIESIKDLEFLTYRTEEDDQTYRGAAESMYLADDDLRSYFETKADTRFIEIDDYRKLTGDRKEEQLLDFLRRLGVQQVPVFKEVQIDPWSRNDLPHPHYTQYCKYSETIIDGCKEIIGYITHNSDKEKSVLLWDILVKIIQTKISNKSYTYWTPFESRLRGVCSYFYRTSNAEGFDSSDAILLKTAKWLVTKDGSFVSASEISLSDLPDEYDTSSADALMLINFLGLKEEAEEPEDDKSNEEEDDSNLTDRQREEIGLARQLKEAGINSPEELQALLALKKEIDAVKAARDALEKQPAIPQPDEAGDPCGNAGHDGQDGTAGQSGKKGTEESGNGPKKHGADRQDQETKKKIWDEIARRSQKDAQNKPDNDQEDGDDIDSDPMTPSPVDYGKRIDRAKEKSAAELNKIAHLEELQEKAVHAAKYSYGWFCALLEMESLSNSKDSANGGREVSISFSLIEREPGTKRTLVLRHPNRYIPQFMEELADIPMILHMGDMTKTVPIEVASVRSYTLRVKVKNASSISGIDLSSVNEVTISAQSPAFLLEELRKQFLSLGEKLHLEDDYDMQKNLCYNIEFIFGPPGTGKTTYLAKNVLKPLMADSGQCRVLVLTPTNKAADVLVHRVMETSGGSRDYEKWLVRFGVTGDEEIERSPVFKEKSFNILSADKSITVTTIARFPYDYFMADGKFIYLNGVRWDYIVIDEASMIPLVNIVYPLYCKTPKKFIIAGDPFQIEPITSVSLWQDENIYTMVQLKSFTDPLTVPHSYVVKLLTTQYRSVPDIGGIFSRFAYGGILKHYRNAKRQKQLNLNLNGIADVRTLNILKFPVSRYESIYRAKRLCHSSSYQVYSALFTFEYICFLSKALAARNHRKHFKIGVVAPYRAQADIIDKLLASERLPKEVDVQAGTIHGFQGDECDIIFAVFNAPPSITGSSSMFLNKMNIINVAISRARDYLFIVMPDDNTENVGGLTLVKRVERLIKSTGSWHEELTPDLEKLMFGDSHYLENNSFSTSHQSVNVYGLPEKRYEVRAEDSAVDIQIHRGALKAAGKAEENTSRNPAEPRQQAPVAAAATVQKQPPEAEPSAAGTVSEQPHETETSEEKFEAGDIVRIATGALRGSEGEVEEVDYSINRVRVSVFSQSLGRDVSIVMTLSDIEKK